MYAWRLALETAICSCKSLNLFPPTLVNMLGQHWKILLVKILVYYSVKSWNAAHCFHPKWRTILREKDSINRGMRAHFSPQYRGRGTQSSLCPLLHQKLLLEKYKCPLSFSAFPSGKGKQADPERTRERQGLWLPSRFITV